MIGQALAEVAEGLADLAPLVVVLNPRAEILEKRDAARHKRGYGESFPLDVLAQALERETPRIGLWIDSSDMTVEEVVERVLAG